MRELKEYEWYTVSPVSGDGLEKSRFSDIDSAHKWANWSFDASACDHYFVEIMAHPRGILKSMARDTAKTMLEAIHEKHCMDLKIYDDILYYNDTDINSLTAYLKVFYNEDRFNHVEVVVERQAFKFK